MDFENELTSKILDPIHGTIRLTTLEIAFINHPLFQRLRNIKQNSFLYKVFPSAVHSRFEHSLGVLHLSSEILNNLRLNAIRYQKKYDDGHVFGHIDQIPKHNIQELRLAALMHDIGQIACLCQLSRSRNRENCTLLTKRVGLIRSLSLLGRAPAFFRRYITIKQTAPLRRC